MEIVINQCDLFQDGRLVSPREAARRQHTIEARISEVLVDHPNACVVYYGIAHIPLLFLVGYRMSNRRAVTLFDFDRYTRLWNQLHGAQDVLHLELSGLPSCVQHERGDIVLRISISYRITPEVTADIVPLPIGNIDLGLAQPKLDSVVSEQQVVTCGRTFRQAMDSIHELYPYATGIHIFYAGPPSVAVYCGQQVSKTIHPRLVVYNYVAKDTPNYSWGIDLTRDLEAADFVVGPTVSTQALRGNTSQGHNYTIAPLPAMAYLPEQ